MKHIANMNIHFHNVPNFDNLLITKVCKMATSTLWKLLKFINIYYEHTCISYLHPLVIQWRMLYINRDTGEANSKFIKNGKTTNNERDQYGND